jgi:hypothetical protein
MILNPNQDQLIENSPTETKNLLRILAKSKQIFFQENLDGVLAASMILASINDPFNPNKNTKLNSSKKITANQIRNKSITIGCKNPHYIGTRDYSITISNSGNRTENSKKQIILAQERTSLSELLFNYFQNITTTTQIKLLNEKNIINFKNFKTFNNRTYDNQESWIKNPFSTLAGAIFNSYKIKNIEEKTNIIKSLAPLLAENSVDKIINQKLTTQPAKKINYLLESYKKSHDSQIDYFSENGSNKGNKILFTDARNSINKALDFEVPLKYLDYDLSIVLTKNYKGTQHLHISLNPIHSKKEDANLIQIYRGKLPRFKTGKHHTAIPYERETITNEMVQKVIQIYTTQMQINKAYRKIQSQQQKSS